MRQQHFRTLLIAGAVLWLTPQPTIESTTQHQTQIHRSNQPRATRYTHRQTMQLHQLPRKWQRLAWCESRNHVHANRNNTYYGLWQIHKGWFKPFNINPATATIAEQYKVAQRVYERQGHDAWTCSTKVTFN